MPVKRKEKESRLYYEKKDRILVLSGSCSPITEQQIIWGLNNGFQGIRVPVGDIINPKKREQIFQETILSIQDLFSKGNKVILYSALGPNDEEISKSKRLLEDYGFSKYETSKILGDFFGRLGKKFENYQKLID